MGEAAKKEEEEKLIPVGPGADGLEANTDHDKDEDAEVEDQRLAQRDEDDEDEPESKVAIARKRESAKERRERQKKQHARERLERDFLLKRNEDLEKRLMVIEGRQSQTETAAIDQRINQITVQLANADRVIADALKKPNGAGAEEFVEAQRIRDELRDQLHGLKSSKTAKDLDESRPRPAAAAPPGPKPDPRVIRNARAWADEHDWFDFNGSDEDSVIVRALDEALAAEGFDPASDEYWEELTARVKRRLPEKFKAGARSRAEDDDEDVDVGESRPRVSNKGPKFSSGGRERPLKKGEVYVSAERKQAMIDYGVWNDPVARNRMLKRYSDWDAEVAASRKT